MEYTIKETHFDGMGDKWVHAKIMARAGTLCLGSKIVEALVDTDVLDTWNDGTRTHHFSTDGENLLVKFSIHEMDIAMIEQTIQKVEDYVEEVCKRFVEVKNMVRAMGEMKKS